MYGKNIFRDHGGYVGVEVGPRHRNGPQDGPISSGNEPGDRVALEGQQQVLQQIMCSSCQRLTTSTAATHTADTSALQQIRTHSIGGVFPILTSASKPHDGDTGATEETPPLSGHQKSVVRLDAEIRYKNRPGVNREDESDGYQPAELYYRCGIMRSNGLPGCGPDPAASLAFYQHAADQGHPKAQARLGYRYAVGSGVRRDQVIALKWLHRAAQQQHVGAMLLLGILHDIGLGSGVQRSIDTAYYWYEKAAAKKNAEAQFRLGTMLSNGLGKGDLGPDSSGYFYTKAAIQGHPGAQKRLGEKYMIGSGVERDLNLAAKWLGQAAHQGYAPAQCQYGQLYLAKGEKSSAVNWLTLASEKGITEADLVFAEMYESGLGVMQNHTLARTFRDWPTVNPSDTVFSMGRLLEEALGAERDTETALLRYKRAASLGHGEAMARVPFVRAEWHE